MLLFIISYYLSVYYGCQFFQQADRSLRNWTCVMESLEFPYQELWRLIPLWIVTSHCEGQLCIWVYCDQQRTFLFHKRFLFVSSVKLCLCPEPWPSRVWFHAVIWLRKEQHLKIMQFYKYNMQCDNIKCYELTSSSTKT